MFSILIIGGTIVDGFGNPPFEGCIGIEDDKIAFVGKLEECRGLDAKKVIEASNLFVSPGFIDLHSHFDETMLMYPSAECGLLQGITTAVGGNCGYSPAPLKKWWLWSFWEEEAIQRLYPYKYYPESAVVPLDEIKPLLRETLGLEINWSTFREYIDVLRATGIGVNIALQVGHNTIRAQVMGKDYKRKATTEEIREMKELVEEAMEAGAIGFSTGLDYEPGAYADTEEIIELAKVAAKYGGLYSTHWRRTGIRRGTSKLLPRKIEGIIEAIEVGRKAGIRVEISHLLPGYIVYPDNEELWRVSARETIKTIEKARESGLEIGFDVIPTETGGVFKIKYLASLLSPCIRDAGNLERLGNLLRAKDYRDEVKRNIQEGKIYSLNPFYITDLAKHITIVKSNVDGISGFTLYEVSEKLNKDIVDLILDLLSEDPTTEIEINRMLELHEASLEEAIKHKISAVVTDTFNLGMQWELKVPPYYLPHPNTYGCFPRFIKKYVVEKNILPIEEAIEKLTSIPARIAGLARRGGIKQGYYADIVVFNVVELDHPLLGDPRQPPSGIKYVLVNGTIVVENSKYNKTLAGRVLLREPLA